MAMAANGGQAPAVTLSSHFQQTVFLEPPTDYQGRQWLEHWEIGVVLFETAILLFSDIFQQNLVV